MPSPFPGIDPYIEALGLWEGFHATLNIYVAEVLNDRLPANYVAQGQQRLKVFGATDLPTGRIPDVFIARRPEAPPVGTGGRVAVAELEPTTIPLAFGKFEVYESWVEVLWLPELELVTAIELLLPTNKAGQGLDDYLEKRAELAGGPAHLVEIDLLLGGHRMPMGRRLPPGDGYAIVARAERRPDAEVYAWSIRRVLPAVPIPLRAPDPDVLLDLARAYALAYDRGGYGRIVRHDMPLPKGFALHDDDRAWAEAVGCGGA